MSVTIPCTFASFSRESVSTLIRAWLQVLADKETP